MLSYKYNTQIYIFQYSAFFRKTHKVKNSIQDKIWLSSLSKSVVLLMFSSPVKETVKCSLVQAQDHLEAIFRRVSQII